MWPFKKKNRTVNSRGARPGGLVDLHNHLLFGLDDGPPDQTRSLAMLELYQRLGYSRVLTTPHINHYMFDTPTPASIVERLEQLAPSATERGISLASAGEIMLRDDYPALFASDRLPGVSGVYLVEFPSRPGSIMAEFEQFIFSLQIKGKTLLIAHPERHPDLQRHPERLAAFRERGALAQVNLPSLGGASGSRVADTAWIFINEGLADVACTDMHGIEGAAAIEAGLEQLFQYDESVFVRLCQTNPGYIFEGRVDQVA